MAICKFCNADKLYWNFNILTKKWELLDFKDNKHKCGLNYKTKSKALPKDSKIEKALQEFQDKLNKERPNRKVKDYWINKY